MCRISLNGDNFKVEATIAPQAEFLNCLLAALVAAAPAFLQALMECLSQGADGYDPGERQRCGQSEDKE